MAKLWFRYGAMGSSKTAQAIMTWYNYRERGKKCLLAKSDVDSRDGKTIIKSRIGLEAEAILIIIVTTQLQNLKINIHLFKESVILVDMKPAHRKANENIGRGYIVNGRKKKSTF